MSISITGLFINALFLLPFYFVVRRSKNKEIHDPLAEKVLRQSLLLKRIPPSDNYSPIIIVYLKMVLVKLWIKLTKTIIFVVKNILSYCKYTMKPYLFSLLLSLLLFTSCENPFSDNDDRPNILWIILDDTGQDFSCYGNTVIQTPVFDSLAANGVLFTNMHATAPIGSPSRSALITGMYQTSNGTHHHRSSRGKEFIFVDTDKPLITDLFKEAGYYIGNVGYDYDPKTDYNFIWNPSMYDITDRIEENRWLSPWLGRRKDQPFFIQIQLEGGKNRRVSRRYPVEADQTRPAPYYPNDALFFQDQASYHSSTLHADKLLHDIMSNLKKDGLDQNTVVMVLSDNGQDNYRDKQWLYQGGTKIPCLIYGPQKYIGKPGQLREDLAIHIDLGPTSLQMAGVNPPDYVQGRDILSDSYSPREYIITARDRCDWTQDRIRAVITPDYKYIRNYFPEKPYMQSNYRDNRPMVKRAKKMNADKELNAVQARFFEPQRPAEEFYVFGQDEFETENQSGNDQYANELATMRTYLDQWIKETGDKGQFPESEASFKEAIKHIHTDQSKQFPLIAGPSALIMTGDTTSFVISFTNTSHKPLDVDITMNSSKGFSRFNSTRSILLEPGMTQDLSLKGHYKRIEEKDSIQISIVTYYTFNDKSGHLYSWKYKLKPIEEYPVVKTWINVDGRPYEWKDLLIYTFGKKDQVRFGITYSDYFVFVGVDVRADSVQAVSHKLPWRQDGIEIRLDAREDPARSASMSTVAFFDHLLLAMSPSETGKPTSFYLPALASYAYDKSFFERELKYASRLTDTGYFTEIAIPVAYLNDLQGGEWKKLRLNVAVHKQNSPSEKQNSWQPAWGSEDDFVGSGSFMKQ